ncbi:MAG: hypothetical protein QOG23_5928, partial [Blastocatellia bacterium]|nr:hypothetical protein [Blastocatellia bacterium]
ADCDALDFYRLVSNRFVNQVIMTYRLVMHSEAALDLASVDRNLFDMQRKDDLGI